MAFLWRTFSLLFCTYYLLTFVKSEKIFTDEFAVHIRGGRSVADELAAKYGYVNKGQVCQCDKDLVTLIKLTICNKNIVT